MVGKGPKGLELEFEKQFMDRVASLPNTFCFPKLEHPSHRGLPDRIFCINGVFCALEMKKTEKEAKLKTGRIVLQRRTLKELRKIGAFAAFCYPENGEEIFKLLSELSIMEPGMESGGH